jgi:hypothetical protein
MTLTVTDKARLRRRAYLDASQLLLDAVDLSTPEDHGQLSLLGGFRAECQGVCGV